MPRSAARRTGVGSRVRCTKRQLWIIKRRQARYTEHIVGEGLAPLDTRRRALIDSVGKTATTIVETYDRQKEASELAGHVESAVAQTALLEAGAVGLGALITTLIASSAIDITGLLFAGVIAIVGLFVIPYKRNQAKERYREKMQNLRTRLMGALSSQFNAEAENAIARMKDGVGLRRFGVTHRVPFARALAR